MGADRSSIDFVRRVSARKANVSGSFGKKDQGGET